MTYSKSINIFLPTGTSDGPIELEMLNWNDYKDTKKGSKHVF